jgi:hypothetical protein
LNKSGSGLIFGELTLISSDSSTENFDLTPSGHFFNGRLTVPERTERASRIVAV